ncbi:uncharacterized mitochondrial protein AtMg00810-like [Rhododendron vialii]|uniref:uncharacterized mitochondrial protein AtMg00810-like n=1 Tax=Rhododendron vialii TaxID=182163 RepID=UPI00265FB129|nr:uncharacterized mitochondrial protein AtMg00810-like [Rhododendron vialii]
MLSQPLISLGFQNSLADSSLFVLHKGSDLVYVDDILITGSSSELVATIVDQLSSSFALKDLGLLHYFLGIEAIPTADGFILSQAKYALNLLTKAGMIECRPCHSHSSLKPVTPGNLTPLTNPEHYRSLIGSLQHLTLTRPEISFAVNTVCQHMHAPLECHLTAVKQILRYIKGTLARGLAFSKSSLTLLAFSDADWAGNALDRCSTGGIVFLSVLISYLGQLRNK